MTLVGTILALILLFLFGAIVILFVVSIGFLCFRWHRRRQPPPGHCQKCGYDLTGNVSGVCPECGTPIKARSREGRQAHPPD